MSDALTIPAWVPAGVKLMYEVGPLKNDCARRLLTDPRMKAAWTQLRNLVPATDAPAPSYHPSSPYMQQRVKFVAPGCNPEAYGDLEQDLTDFDRLSAALYYETVATLSQSQEPMACTAAEAESWAKPYFEAAQVCDLQISIESAWPLKQDLVAALEITRSYLLNQGQMRLMIRNPRVLDRSRGEASDKLRGQARAIAVSVRDLFGPFEREFPHAAVARIAVVSLDRNDDIEALKKRIPGWCQSLPTQISPYA